MIDAARQLAATALAALRDNPLARYGSPARRVGVPRALWWLALGGSLFGSAMLTLTDGMVQSGLEPYQLALGGAYLTMPLLVALAFVGFAPLPRRGEGGSSHPVLFSVELFVGYAWWPAVACGLLVLPLVLVPWVAAIAAVATPLVEQAPLVFHGRVMESAGLPLWTMLCLAVAVRVWHRRPHPRWLLPVGVSARCYVHLLWMTSLALGSGSFCRLAQDLAFRAVEYSDADARNHLVQTLEGLPWSIAPWENMAVLLAIFVAAITFEVRRSLSALSIDAAQATAIPSRHLPPEPVPQASILGSWWMLAAACIVGFEALNFLQTRLFYLPRVDHLPVRSDLGPSISALMASLIAITVVDTMRRAGFRDQGRCLPDNPGMAALGCHLWLPCWIAYVYYLMRFNGWPPSQSGWATGAFDFFYLKLGVVVDLAELYLVTTFILATMRPAGDRTGIGLCWLLFAGVLYLPPLDGIPTEAMEAAYTWSLLEWYRSAGRWPVVSLAAMVFLALGWRACAMWFEASRHRLADPEATAP